MFFDFINSKKFILKYLKITNYLFHAHQLDVQFKILNKEIFQ